MSDEIRKIFSKNKEDEGVGLPSVCSAHPFVVAAALEHARKLNRVACLESTGQQVNQYGGYSGIDPEKFAEHVRQTAEKAGLGPDQVVLGGDHLGPGPWRSETSDAAMAKAFELIRKCVRAGYRKLHLDPSMPCRDDVRDGRPYISVETIAERTASLCACAEGAAASSPNPNAQLLYVAGTEVPLPGGEPEESADIPASSAAKTEETIGRLQAAFAGRGLESAWNRCVAIVVQTGAAFGPETIWEYDSQKTSDLKALIQKTDHLVYEAHSTDYQSRKALGQMVRDHFAILKVGPNLTFAMRETLFALEQIEREFLGNRRGLDSSDLSQMMLEVMTADRTHWQNHYHGSPEDLRYLLTYGFSDRIRYYWSNPRIAGAVAKLFDNLTQYGIPLPLLSQYLPAQYEAIRERRIPCTPGYLVKRKIMEVLDRYTDACCDPVEERR